MTTNKQKDVLSFFGILDSPKPKRLKAEHFLPPHAGRLARDELFSVFKKKHAEEAASVYNFLLNCDDYNDFKAHVYNLREILNEGLYMYAISVACLHRRELTNTHLPPHYQIHARRYFPHKAITEVIDKTKPSKKEKDEMPHFHTGTSRDPEFKLAWWREDVEINTHHYHWHLVYAWPGFEGKTKDREGELFYYMHQQMVARYDAERLAVGLLRVEPFVDWNRPIPGKYSTNRSPENVGTLAGLEENYRGLCRSNPGGLCRSNPGGAVPPLIPPIDLHTKLGLFICLSFLSRVFSPNKEGYNSHLTDYYGTTQYAPRPANMYLSDSLEDPDNPVLVSQQEYHYYRLLDAINTGKFLKSDNTKEDVTIDRLGAAVEASVSSPNGALYGSLHNSGHDLLGSIADPDGRYKMISGVMGDPSTSVRDPVFFRWHKFIDNLFVQHKRTLSPYAKKDLEFDDVKITSVCVKPGNDNVLKTRMKDVVHDIAHDMFIRQAGPSKPKHTPVLVKVQQVNHDQFTYNIRIRSEKPKRAAIRIFMAPAYNEENDTFDLQVQRRLFIEMDKFVIQLKGGDTTITRESNKSSVIKPTDKTVSELLNATSRKRKRGNDCPCREDRYCGCGWPEHLLLPRGTPSGMKYDLFVMATDWDAEKITDLDKGSSYCGLRDEKFPDSRSMGFPFDRKIEDTRSQKDKKKQKFKIEDWADHFNNMHTIQITIKYNQPDNHASLKGHKSK